MLTSHLNEENRDAYDLNLSSVSSSSYHLEPNDFPATVVRFEIFPFGTIRKLYVCNAINSLI